MNVRIQKLREQSVNAMPYISPERALLVTEFHKNEQAANASPPVRRAMVLKYIMEHKSIYIGPGELIVGERGPAPKAVPTYPELTAHTLSDLDILNSREKIPFKVDAATRDQYQNIIIPYWKGRTIREKIFAEMGQDWKEAFGSGVFTEFMEQRAPGHTVLDGKIYHKGMLDFRGDVQRALSQLDFLNDPLAYNKREELRAMDVAIDAILTLARRHAEKAAELAGAVTDPIRKNELDQIRDVCTHVPAHAPRSFREALQYYWFVHLCVITELNPWDSFNPGKLDQHLFPFYQNDVARGLLNRESAKELLQAFWIKFNNQPAPPKVGVTAEESATYADFAQINSGGVKPDGSDAVNDVSYLILEVMDEMRLIQPSPSVQISKRTPDKFLKQALRVARNGFGQPSIFNTDAVIQELVRQGKSVEDAREGGTSGCVETGAFGKENYNLTGYFNLVKVLEITLHNGLDPRTGKRIGLATGDPRDFSSFNELFAAYKRQLSHFINIKIKANNIIERIYADNMPVPFLSLLIDDCIARGLDYHNGGARYNTSYIQGVGTGTITDSLAALKYHIFEARTFAMHQLLEALEDNFHRHEKIRDTLLNRTPRYGNDDDYADSLMLEIFEAYYEAVNGRMNTKGGHYRINLLPTTCHIYFGSVVNATPDGRLAGKPLSEGISPVQGADRKGPTAVIKSVTKMDHVRTGGTLLNMKFSPQVLDGENGITKLMHLVRTYFKWDGHHIQFNVVDAKTLRDAQKNPQLYRDLIVRVAGYSDYFVDLGRELQEEIISRTEHQDF
ncbi:MAG: trans-4-hydroxy-L-proline dehydratase [Candidatus Zhuqueibacterota bacterium]